MLKGVTLWRLARPDMSEVTQQCRAIELTSRIRRNAVSSQRNVRHDIPRSRRELVLRLKYGEFVRGLRWSWIRKRYIASESPRDLDRHARDQPNERGPMATAALTSTERSGLPSDLVRDIANSESRFRRISSEIRGTGHLVAPHLSSRLRAPKKSLGPPSINRP